MSATLIEVTQVGDPRLEPYRNIRERDVRRRDDLFIAEGSVVLDALAAASAFEPVSILLLRNRLEGIRHILSRFDPSVPAYVVSRDVIDRVAGFPMHRGVLALARRRDEPEVRDLLELAPSRVLVASGLANHDNVGACFRIASAFGVGVVLLDGTCADPLYRKAIRVSTGAVLRVPFRHGGETMTLLDELERQNYRTIALSPSGRTSLVDIKASERMALVVGAEGGGLPDAILDRLETVAIPMATGHDSLNVAISAAIAFYALGPVAGANVP